MTRLANARLAGFTYLFYIAVAFPAMVLIDRATAAQSTAAKLTLIAAHSLGMRIAIVLGVLASFSAVVLAVALYGVTRDEDDDLARIALACRVGEGVLGAASTMVVVSLLWLATTGRADASVESAASLGAVLLKANGWSTTIAAVFFAVGSTIFCWLLLRGRMIPVPLARLGVFGSAILVVGLPLQLAGFVTGTLAQLMWIPVAGFELTVAPWLLIRGVSSPNVRQSVV